MTNKSNTRKIVLKGVHNFRDVGGYLTSEDKKIKWRKLFRSDNLARLTTSDIRRIEALNIRCVIDLRSKEERCAKPSRLLTVSNVKTKNIEISNRQGNQNELKKKLFSGKSVGMNMEEYVFDAYRRAITDYQDELKAFFELLLNPENYPAIVFCDAGKDRTGVLIALVLLMLGVSKETIIKDYMLSKVYLDPIVRRMIMKVRLFSLFRADIFQLKSVLDTRIEYLSKTFDAIAQKFDSTQAFFDSLGIDETRRKTLRTILCS